MVDNIPIPHTTLHLTVIVKHFTNPQGKEQGMFQNVKGFGAYSLDFFHENFPKKNDTGIIFYTMTVTIKDDDMMILLHKADRLRFRSFL